MDTIEPESFEDEEGYHWNRNKEGKYDCLNTRIKNMRYEEVVDLFGPITPLV